MLMGGMGWLYRVNNLVGYLGMRDTAWDDVQTSREVWAQCGDPYVSTAESFGSTIGFYVSILDTSCSATEPLFSSHCEILGGFGADIPIF